tara:strand:- start:1791 stop:2201 length:411 start_codon:yes stop_codon:yes gene_type:complete
MAQCLIEATAWGMQRGAQRLPCRDCGAYPAHLALLIGVHSGVVIAGVIRKQKFSDDLWGNTVNVASRMESEGIADQIQISTETRKLLSERYQTSPRGEILIKGHRAPEHPICLKAMGCNLEHTVLAIAMTRRLHRR